jgi:hypothetical protein
LHARLANQSIPEFIDGSFAISGACFSIVVKIKSNSSSGLIVERKFPELRNCQQLQPELTSFLTSLHTRYPATGTSTTADLLFCIVSTTATQSGAGDAVPALSELPFFQRFIQYM